jgi:hypothetical protein
MENHLHLSAIDAVKVFALVIIAEFFLHWLALYLTAKGSDWGPAFSFFA